MYVTYVMKGLNSLDVMHVTMAIVEIPSTITDAKQAH